MIATILWLIIGLLPSALAGWLAVRLLERETLVLWRAERWAMAAALGPTMVMYIAFLLHVTIGLPLSLTGYMTAHALCLLPLTLFWVLRRDSPTRRMVQPAPPSSRMPLGLAILLGLLLVVSSVKIVGLSLPLFLTPTYYDDSIDNWNYRGRVFYEAQKIELTLPPDAAPGGISSYPPSLPMIKAWLATIHGGWDEGLINGLHIVWFGSILVLLFCALRRRVSLGWSLLGVYLLCSLPLFMTQAFAAYADVFLAAHLFCAILALVAAGQSTEKATALAFFRIAALPLALLGFAKNEGLILYLPLLLALGAWAMWKLRRAGTLTTRDIGGAVLWIVILVLVVCVPWILYKRMNGLTFGNAKSISDIQLGWQPHALLSITINTLFEANWLLFFPLLGTLLILRARSVTRSPLALLAGFLLVAYCAQLFLYLFTGLSQEAIRQTGYARGLIHLMPAACMLAILLLKEALGPPDGQRGLLSRLLHHD